jgi:hypothetical protein
MWASVDEYRTSSGTLRADPDLSGDEEDDDMPELHAATRYDADAEGDVPPLLRHGGGRRAALAASTVTDTDAAGHGESGAPTEFATRVETGAPQSIPAGAAKKRGAGVDVTAYGGVSVRVSAYDATAASASTARVESPVQTKSAGSASGSQPPPPHGARGSSVGCVSDGDGDDAMPMKGGRQPPPPALNVDVPHAVTRGHRVDEKAQGRGAFGRAHSHGQQAAQVEEGGASDHGATISLETR